MRGKDRDLAAVADGQRITPAHAGKSCGCGRIPQGRADHPRACGEKTPVRFYENGVPGSPPRMRGKGVKARYERVAVGITPAYAGKRALSVWRSAFTRDHPRVCGEKLLDEQSKPIGKGSPPRMRGKGHLRLLHLAVSGITPAYAGKSLE